MNNDDFPLITRKAGVELARAKLGIPISIWTINRAMANGTGPKPVAKYGSKQDLFRPGEFLDWARSLVVERRAARSEEAQRVTQPRARPASSSSS